MALRVARAPDEHHFCLLRGTPQCSFMSLNACTGYPRRTVSEVSGKPTQTDIYPNPIRDRFIRLASRVNLA
jgi:hypothetical protein